MATGNVIQGNYIGTDATGTVGLGNNASSVRVSGSPNTTIGGTAAGERNVLSGNGSNGVFIQNSSTGNVIQGNFIGTDVTGTVAVGNGADGVVVSSGSSATIGGTTAGARNVISGNFRGVSILTAGNTVQGNSIGTNAAGTAAIPNNAEGVRLGDAAVNNTIGGTTAGAGNLISGNTKDGVLIGSPTATGNTIQGNFIGTDATGTAPIPNTGNGVAADFNANGNTIGGVAAGAGNLIAFNIEQGVSIGRQSNAQQISVLGNSIHSNGTLGIDLRGNGVTANDRLDADTGPNGFQNYPVLASAVGNQIFGSLHSTPNTGFHLEFFADTARDPSGFGEGRTFLGATGVFTDASGNATFTFNAPSDLTGQFVTATATKFLSPGGQFTDTSEFSNSVLVLPTPTQNPPTPNPTPNQVPNPIPTATPPAIPQLVPQLLPGTPFQVPLLLPTATPPLIPQLTPALLAPNPVLNTPLTAPGVTPVVTAGQIAPTAGAGAALQPKASLVVGAGLNGHSIIVVYNADGTERGRLTAFPGFLGGVRVAAADVNHDGHPDIIAGAGAGGGPHVKVFSGVDGSELRSFYAYDPAFTGGVYVAGGDVNGDGYAEIITGAGAGGGPHVKVFDGATGQELASFYAYHVGFGGGVTVAAGDLNNDGLADVVTGAGPGGGSHVKVVEGTSLRQVNADGTIADAALLASFYAYTPAFAGGVFVTTGSDLNRDGLADVITGAGPGGGPHVKIVDTARANQLNPDGGIADASLLASFYAFEERFAGGVRVGEADALQDGVNEIIVGAGPTGGPRVRVLRASGLSVAEDFFAFVPAYNGGVFVD